MDPKILREKIIIKKCGIKLSQIANYHYVVVRIDETRFDTKQFALLQINFKCQPVISSHGWSKCY